MGGRRGGHQRITTQSSHTSILETGTLVFVGLLFA